MADDKKQKTLFLDEAAAGAPPRGAPPSSGQSTMMLDAAQAAPAAGQRQMVVPTMMQEAPRHPLPPVDQRPRQPAWGRWVAGPIIAIVVAAGTVVGAGVVMPRHKGGEGGGLVPGKPMGRLRVNTTPPGASVLVDGRRHPRFTPTTVEGDIGATLHLTFSADGYQPKDADVYVAEGEHPFNVKLDPATAPAPVAPPPAPEAAPVAPPAKHPAHVVHAPAPPKEPAATGTATISVIVRPWAIVFVDKQRLRQTPINGYSLPAGKHVIELVNEGKSRREKVEVTLKPGEEQEIHRDWDK
jgi:PEGA domain-containing protein